MDLEHAMYDQRSSDQGLVSCRVLQGCSRKESQRQGVIMRVNRACVALRLIRGSSS